MAELDGGGHADLGEARDVFRREQLRVLDALAEAARAPVVRGLLEGVEGVPIRPVADGVHSHRPAEASGPAHDLGELVPARDLHARAVEQPRGLGAECPVHERLQVAGAEVVVAEARGDAYSFEVFEALVRQRLPDAQGQRALAL